MTAPLTIRLHPGDNVIVARMDILPGTRVEGEVVAATRVPPGHKILTRAVKKGEALRKYNQIIGFATDDLVAGTLVDRQFGDEVEDLLLAGSETVTTHWELRIVEERWGEREEQRPLESLRPSNLCTTVPARWA